LLPAGCVDGARWPGRWSAAGCVTPLERRDDQVLLERRDDQALLGRRGDQAGAL
jgi:hypothetical protein